MDDAEITATSEGVHAAQIEGRLSRLCTGMVGIVHSFDGDKQTVEVQPAIKRIFFDQGACTLPLLVDCPCYFPGGGDFVLTIPPAQGDECWLAFSSRALDFWFEQGGVQLPADMRMHDMSDAVAFVGLRSKPRVLANFNTSAAELRTVDGTMAIRLETGLISLGAGMAPLVPPVNGVMTGLDEDPVLEIPYSGLGAGSSIVVARKS
jgi:hypothetical protein